MTDVFLCYARSDLDFARHLAEALRERATDMFVDLGEWWHDELAGEPIRASEEPAYRAGSDGTDPVSVDSSNRPPAREPGIEVAGTVGTTERVNDVHAAITGSTAVLVVVSRELMTSSRCRHEIERALTLHKRMVLVGREAVSVDNLPEELRSLKVLTINARDFETGARRLVEALEADSPRISSLGVVAPPALVAARPAWRSCASASGCGDTRTCTPHPRSSIACTAALALFRDNTTIYSGRPRARWSCRRSRGHSRWRVGLPR